MIAQVRKYEFAEVSKQISQLLEVGGNGDDYSAVLLMKNIVPEFISNNSHFEKLDKEANRSKA
jgi:ferritin